MIIQWQHDIMFDYNNKVGKETDLALKSQNRLFQVRLKQHRATISGLRAG